jgi:hypothetical protein
MFTIFASFVLVCIATLVIAQIIAHHATKRLTRDAWSLHFALQGANVAADTLARFTGASDSVTSIRDSIIGRTLARVSADEHTDRIALTLRPSLPSRVIAKVRREIAWAHATSPVLRALARPMRVARFHLVTAVKVAVLVAVVASAGCSLVRALPTKEEARRSTASILGAASSNARFLR